MSSRKSLPRERTGLGPLETRVLEYMWGERRALTVARFCPAFPKLAYTTLMTTLDRLHRKGLLVRRREGRAFTYEPRCSRDELLSERMSSDVSNYLSAVDQSTALLSTFVRTVGRTNVALLEELDELLQAERLRLKKREAT
jgi:predicted transcriptional regulator